jgi:hypothetical protein
MNFKNYLKSDYPRFSNRFQARQENLSIKIKIETYSKNDSLAWEKSNWRDISLY